MYFDQPPSHPREPTKRRRWRADRIGHFRLGRQLRCHKYGVPWVHKYPTLRGAGPDLESLSAVTIITKRPFEGHPARVSPAFYLRIAAAARSPAVAGDSSSRWLARAARGRKRRRIDSQENPGRGVPDNQIPTPALQSGRYIVAPEKAFNVSQGRTYALYILWQPSRRECRFLSCLREISGKNLARHCRRCAAAPGAAYKQQ